jgi:parvulin-like peptidyl-prolyl isomerase
MAIIVNGERIEDAQIRDEVERLRPSYEKTFADKSRDEREAELVEWSQENLIEETLFRQELKADNRTIAAEIVDRVIGKLSQQFGSRENLLKVLGADEKSIRAEAERYARERLRIAEIGHSAPAPTAAQVRDYYEQNQDKYVLGEQVRVTHIFKRLGGSVDEAAVLAALTQASAEIHAGKPFETVGPKCAAAIDDIEDLGYIQRGEMPVEFDDVVFHLGPGEVSHVFRTRIGLHIAKVYERRPPRCPPLQDIRERVAHDLAEQMREEAFAAHLDELRRQATIEYV